MNRGDYDDADALVTPTPAPAVELPPRQWHPADRDLCSRVSTAHFAAGDEIVALEWASLAARIQRALVGEYATFGKADARLVQAEHFVTLRARLEADDVRAAVKARSRALSRLGVLVLEASRGRVELVRSVAR